MHKMFVWVFEVLSAVIVLLMIGLAASKAVEIIEMWVEKWHDKKNR